MRWAEEQGLIDRSPIAHFKKPRAGCRTTVIEQEEFERILANAPNEDSRDLVRFAWLTGARAAECLRLAKRHVDIKNARIVFPVEEEKMRRAPRIIYLSDEALQIVRRRLMGRGERVFTNSHGKPWTADAVNCAFEHVRIRIGKEVLKDRGITVPAADLHEMMARLKPHRINAGIIVVKTQTELREEAKRKLIHRLAKQHAPKHCLTEFRHSWCHHALRRGLDALTVSVLMGHAGLSMVTRVYSHLNHAPTYLSEQARKASE